MDSYTDTKYPIDAVILWVDGNDENHRKKMLPYIENKESRKNAEFRTRFDQVEEVKFTVDSILKNASWVRNIFIVTDDQTPQFLKQKEDSIKYKNVAIVDHKIIFQGYEQYLPTFNSRSIETMMFRIPGLAEHFIFFNDDYSIIKKTYLSDFFKNGLPVLRGKWSKFDEDRIKRKIQYLIKGEKYKDKPTYKRTQQKSAKILGFKNYFRYHHTPLALRKSTFLEVHKQFPSIMIENIQHKFRNINQLYTQVIANHMEIKNNTCVIKNGFQSAYLQSYKKPILWYKLYFYYIQQNSEKLFLCLQSLDRCDEKKLRFVRNFLSRICK
jgi:hypothetical protein